MEEITQHDKIPKSNAETQVNNKSENKSEASVNRKRVQSPTDKVGMNRIKEESTQKRSSASGNVHRRIRSEGTDRPVRPEGTNRPVRPEGTNRPVRPEGTNRPVRPEGTNRPVRPEGTNRPVRPEGTNRPVRPEGMNSATNPDESDARLRTGNVLTSGSQEMRKRSVRNKRKKTTCIVIGVILLVFILLGAVAAMLYQQKYGLSDEEMSSLKYYDMSRDAELAVIIDSEVLGAGGIVENGTAYFSYDVVQEYFNSRFYWDSGTNSILYTLEDGTVTATVGESVYKQTNSEVATNYQIVKTDGSAVYVAAEYVALFTNIEYEIYEDPNRIVVTSDWTDIETVTAQKDTQVRYQAGVKSPILSYVAKGDVLTFLDDDVEDWTKVCTADGYVGYVQTKNLSGITTVTLTSDFVEQEYTNISLDYTINMAWHQVTSSEANDSVLTTVANTSGLTTIAPTWFFINDTDGNVKSLASQTYVNYVHQLGIDVWAVLNDFDGEMNSYEDTYAVLSSTTSRAQIINTVVAEAIQTGIDGINVDIENVSTEAGEHYIQFIRELSVKCRQNNIVLSVANYPPKAYNMHFDYEEQGIVADYVIIMGYDEHYSTSLEAGSVSSLGYVEEGITEMLTMVSADKIISGIPFYTRLWEETPKSDEELAEQAGTEEGEYLTNVTSQAYGMANARTVVEQAGVTATWDETTGQNYATWIIDNTTYQIWLEDAESIEAKLQLMKNYNLAGTAAWKLGFEDSDIWAVIQKYVN